MEKSHIGEKKETQAGERQDANTSRGQMLLARLGVDIAGDVELQLRADEPMSKHTTNRLGGPADVWVKPKTMNALERLLAKTHALGIPVTCVGGGSNLLVRDGGIRGVVVNLGSLNQVSRVDETKMWVDAGASTGRALNHALQWDLGGVEFLGGVPGSVGGGLIMNAGTYVGEFTDVVAEVHSLRFDGSKVVRAHAQCGFRYRGSDLPRDEIVIGALLQLKPRPRAEMEVDVAALRRRRDEREPHGVPNNGSTFKNPPGDYAGRLIETAGLKGLRVGGAVVSEVHANWLVVDRAISPPCTAKDMIELIERVRQCVFETHGVTLEPEVKIIGEL